MARDSGGTYTPPAGNPVVTATTISSTVHNNTVDDLGDEITDSLSRSGKGSMTAALKLSDGTVSLPGLAFSADLNTGLYRITDDELGIAIGGTLRADFKSGRLNLTYSDAVTLTDATNAVNLGDETAAHLAISPAIIQAKSDATTATALGINTLGGDVTVGLSGSTVNLGGTVSLTDDTIDVADGGTGSGTAAGARTNLGAQAQDDGLDDIAALAVTNSNFIVGNGSAWVAESGATARTSLGLGSLATLSSVNNGNWSGTDLAVANGGTAASDAATARTNLGVGSMGERTLTVDTSGPSGGSDDDIWFEREA